MGWLGEVPAVEIQPWLDRRRARVAVEQLRGAEKVLELADRMRRNGGTAPHRLFHECVQAFVRAEVAFDDVTRLYKHAMIHAGAIRPRDRPRFYHCPECGAEFDDGAGSG